ncbi:MAG: LptF/LptG family permease, partial [Proteobacteria bacterium]|nr:LptF/LptG family permease [Pseudomonadota bacterium]
IQEQVRNKSPQSLTIEEISQRLNAEGEMSPQESRILQTEFHKRWAISLVCLIFGLLGVGLGTVTNRRSGKSSGLVVSLVLIILYWVLYVSLEGAARSGKLPPALAIWTPNFLFLLFAAWSLKKNWN